MINKNGETVVEHHVKYKELHGVDETVWMTMSEHKKLHNRLRKNEKCNVPPKELNVISFNAFLRTKKEIKRRKSYFREYRKTDHYKDYKKEYRQNYSDIEFDTWLDINVHHRETIRYNTKTGSVSVISKLQPANRKHLFYIEEI